MRRPTLTLLGLWLWLRVWRRLGLWLWLRVWRRLGPRLGLGLRLGLGPKLGLRLGLGLGLELGLGLGLGLAAGCGADTGIIIATAGDAVDELEFQVAVAEGSELVLDPGASGERRGVQGRNLRASPYELLLREGSDGGDPLTVRVLALGYTAGKLVSFGLTEPPQTFIRGEVLRRALTLVGVGGDATLAAPGQERSCFRVRLEPTSPVVRLHTRQDADCDGSSAPADCNDQDETIYPGAEEICDGKDNNCDNLLAPDSQLCYGFDRSVDPPVCREGTRACYESQGKGQGLDPSCVISARRAAEAYCREYGKCTGAAPLACTLGRVRVVNRDCQIVDVGDGKLCAAHVALAAPAGDGSACRWEIVDAGGWPVELSDPGICAPALGLRNEPAGTGPVVLEFFYGTGLKQSQVVVVKLTPKTAAECGARPLTCK